jgi:uncharacterized protein (DUF885 family)
MRKILLAFLPALFGQAPPHVERPARIEYAAPAAAELQEAEGLRAVVERFTTDLRALERFYPHEASPYRVAAMRRFFTSWRGRLGEMDYAKLGRDGQYDWLLLDNVCRRELRGLDLIEQRNAETAGLLPFAADLYKLLDARQRVETIDAQAAATKLFQVERQIGHARKELASQKGKVKPVTANRAARLTRALAGAMKDWHGFYAGYDPLFTWWAAEPYGKFAKAMEDYAVALREQLAGVSKDDKDTIIGDPIGDAALRAELGFEYVPYTPEELVKLAEKEFAWCDREMLKASRELGFGDDWKKALEHVKTLHVGPGKQAELVRDQVFEAIAFLEARNLVTIPAYAKDVWRVRMMTPEQQRVNPFFTGGEVLSVSFPTDGMAHEAKLMSLRGNNIHFSRATVHHEVIPGHHLQMYMTQRHRPYRRAFSTPFWMEGWALYWEFRLWDLGFPQTPENRIGMLFWRMHRCARIIFSLNFHLEKMTAQEAVNFLVERVGHERENAAAEVRRSFETDYPPLYQAAYMLGGLQLRGLHGELVGTGKMTERAFHDAILQSGTMPIEFVRASLTGRSLEKGFRAGWRFYGEP